MRRPLPRSQVSPSRHRLSNLWFDIESWKWWPRIGIAVILCVVGIAIATEFVGYKGELKSAEEKCWNWGGRSDDTWNC